MKWHEICVRTGTSSVSLNCMEAARDGPAAEGEEDVMIEVYALNLTDRLEKLVEKFLRFFLPERQEKILFYRFTADRNRTLWAELLVRYVLAKKESCPLEEISVWRDGRGKPHAESSSWEISLSHSRHWAVCSVGEMPSGVDVEEAAEDALAIARHFFTEREYRLIQALDEKNRAREFLRIWTIKESYAKYTGQGMDEAIAKRESAELLAGSGPIAGRNFVVDGAVIGLCGKREILPGEVCVVPSSFFVRFE